MLLSAKLSLPYSPEIVIPRPRLFEKLNQASAGRLTVIATPAGYGKSTLVANWLVQQGAADPAQIDSSETGHSGAGHSGAGHSGAWLLLDKYDNEPVRFMDYFIAALQQLVPGIGQALQETMQGELTSSSGQTVEGLLALLITELTSQIDPKRNFVLVLDDFHLLTNQQLIDGIRFWVEHTPAFMHTMLLCRDASTLPMARWRVRRQCTELTIDDLSFTLDEAAEFTDEMLVITLTESEVAQLTARTEGWIAGLQLAALSLQTADNPAELLEHFTGSDRHVMDYLIEEVLQKQSQETRSFLLHTSALKRLSPSLCDSVLGITNSYEILEQMEKRNLFLMPLDNQREWYRYHPLFAEALQTRVRLAQGQENIANHSRAYEWFVEHQLYEEAVEQAIMAELYPEAAECLEEIGPLLLWHESRSQTFIGWCNTIPEEYLYARPLLVIYRGWARLMSSGFSSLIDVTTDIRSAWAAREFDFKADPQIRIELAVLEAEVAVVEGEISKVMQILDPNDSDIDLLTPTTKALAHQLIGYAHRLDGNIAAAKDALQKGAHLMAQIPQHAGWIFAQGDLAETYVMAGESKNAQNVFNQISQRFPPERYPHYAALANIYINQARMLSLGNHLTEAMQNVQRGLSMCTTDSWMYIFGRMIQGEIQHLQGDRAAVEETIAYIDSLSSLELGSRRQAKLERFKARQWLLYNEERLAGPILQQYQADRPTAPRYIIHQIDVAYGRYLLTMEPTRAVEALTTLKATAQSAGWLESLVEINILLAFGHQTLSEYERALDALSQALTVAEGAELLAPFLVEGAKIVSLLRQAAQQTAHRSFVGQLQAAFLPATAPPASAATAQPLAEPLTKRELDVLRMIADGLSNPEIAENLILATGTIAKHSNNIFGKLNVRNRTEATKRAQALGLI